VAAFTEKACSGKLAAQHLSFINLAYARDAARGADIRGGSLGGVRQECTLACYLRRGCRRRSEYGFVAQSYQFLPITRQQLASRIARNPLK
jgi:hypothetical protein